MARASKSPAVRDAEKRVERRRDEVVAAARTYRAARVVKVADTRTVLADLLMSVEDLDKAERELADARAASLEPSATIEPQPPTNVAEAE
ncbi:hypothetical protein [Sandaracinus amylolyticus]|uniref:Uncharacterized protein n=1 Tax=Sandaracinus amylolyticus TaxID=927083 RepID=A0A0F6W2W1_9BACT|nr:hypothetical protein [Sandaracinus amylolyticus]AKF06056.1 hypothetical protein DB32_003205 [Sandaracinus amylolyticus]